MIFEKRKSKISLEWYRGQWWIQPQRKNKAPEPIAESRLYQMLLDEYQELSAEKPARKRGKR